MTQHQEQRRLTVQFGRESAEVVVAADGTLQQLATALADRFSVAPHTIKLLVPGSKGALRLGEDQAGVTVQEAGLRDGARVKMLASRQADVEAVQAAREDGRMASFEQELRRELRRVGAAPAAKGPPAGPHTFQRYEAWQRSGLTPPPSEALKLLHRLAADPGIVGVMGKHKWTVGLLSEMPPEGKVGVSPVCILGVNINRGQEISLRLRTDDLRGFRRYDRIRETLLHELAHMVWGEHDDNFKELNSQLRRECDAFDWRGAAALSLAGPAFEGTVDYHLPPEQQTVMQQTAAASGKKLGGGTVPAADARQAAAEAALRRAKGGAAEAAVGPSSTSQPAPQQLPQQHYTKGQIVMYRQRDGTWTQAKIAAVDSSVLPYSYGIEIEGHYRETEASRLAPLAEPADGTAAVEGLGHRDAATEAKEAAVRGMER